MNVQEHMLAMSPGDVLYVLLDMPLDETFHN